MTDIRKGLSNKEVEKSRLENGSNEIKEQKRASFLKSFISNLSDPIIRVLIIALFVNIIFMFPHINWFESGGIALSILIATLVSTISEHSSSNAFERLKSQSENALCRVRREGGVVEIPTAEVVVGDIALVGAGEKVYADMRLLDGEITVDESALTGESIEVRKCSYTKSPNECDSTALKGALILAGQAECEIIAVGEGTYYGTVATELAGETRPSPLKHRLAKLAKEISILGYVFAFLIAFAYLFNTFFIDSKMVWDNILLKLKDIKFVLSSLLNALTLAVSIIVVAVPEGLPMMITVVLCSNMKKMTNDGVVVRKLVGIETSGSLNLLFTDKTGTLTEGKLKVKGVYLADGKDFSALKDMSKHLKYKKYLTLCAGYCTGTSYDGKRALGSDATDRAIRDYVKNDVPAAALKSVEPFDSEKKYMTAKIVADGEALELIKGAPEKIIDKCTSYFDSNGDTHPLKSTENVLKILKSLTGASYRAVALAVKRENEAVLIGIMAIRDKIRKEVPNAIREVTSAGVGVIMITGDNKDTAEAIAKECGIISAQTKRSLILTGDMLSKMSDAEIADALPSIAVIARALPTDKSRLVRIAQASGLVVGMTGDGINDASSLKSADVGFSMGSGTDVAKEAGDIVITDNSFTSIVKAILYGRTIFESIRKFIVFQLTMNLAAVGISLIGPFIGVESPVTVSQMLWVNIIMDTLGALAFASEPAEKEFMRQKPKSRDEQIISSPMLTQIISTGCYILALCVWFLKSHSSAMMLTRADEAYLLSAFFCMFIFVGIFVCFTSRTSRVNLLAHLNQNRSFIFIMLLISVTQMSFVYFGGELFRAVPLRAHDLLSVIFIAFSVVIFDFVRKLFFSKLRYKINTHRIKLNKKQEFKIGKEEAKCQ